MTSLSANLGFLWKELPLPDAIRAAKRAGFDAVECHFPFDVPPEATKAALEETGLPMLGLNTLRGDVAAGDFGVAAIPGREAEARGYIEQAVAFARAVGARNVHVIAGKTDGGPAAEATLRANLLHACRAAAPFGIGVFIEPKNHVDIPCYHIASIEQAMETVAAVNAEMGSDRLSMMFDFYHVQIQQGDVTRRFERALPAVGHVQFAAVPDRGEPDDGELDHRHVFRTIARSGYQGFAAAEYAPRAGTEAGLGWMDSLGPILRGA